MLGPLSTYCTDAPYPEPILHFSLFTLASY
jgi:hypothetical protein